MSDGKNPDLEDFRNQWREEVLRRQGLPGRQGEGRAQKGHSRDAIKDSGPSSKVSGLAEFQHAAHDDDYASKTYDFDDLEAREEARKLGAFGSGVHPEAPSSKEPISALDHYEKAVERESQGKLGESLKLYRTAFRLDDCVDQIYKSKHFPPSSFKPQHADSKPLTRSATTVLADTSSGHTQISSLVVSFADSIILNASPLIAGDVPPPCPIRKLPNELHGEILYWIAQTDVAILSRLAQTCKRFAYLITTEDILWKRIVHRSRHGLGGMHFEYICTVAGRSLDDDDHVSDPLAATLSALALSPSQPRSILATLPINLPLTPTYPTYRHMLHHRPRLRFTGVYISVNNYIRPGAASANQITWNTPVHIVTYYRYLRFYRDGTCITLCTTTEPLEVVPHLQIEHVASEFVANTTLPVGVMRHARRGRWKLAPPKEIADFQRTQAELQKTSDPPEDASAEPALGRSLIPETPIPEPESKTKLESPEPEGTLSLETDGPTAAYTYHMKLSMRSAGGVSSAGPKNTKLVWRGFWSHNRVTDDWAPFGLKNDRAFVWSRVRSWGNA